MGEFIGLIAVILIFGSVPAVIVFISSRRHKERLEMLKKGVNPVLFAQTPTLKTGNTPLLWGLIAVALGLAMLFSAVIIQRYDRDMVTFAMFFLFGGAATLLYYKLTGKDRERARQIFEEEHAKAVAEYKSHAHAPETTDEV